MPITDPERRREVARQYREANRAKIREQTRKRRCKYRKAHPERVRECSRKCRARRREESLAGAVRGYGGIDPQSLDFLRHYEGVAHAVEDGVPLAAFRVNGAGLDVLARELHASGHFYCPEGGDLGEYLLQSLRQRLASLNADLTSRYDAALERHYRELEEGGVYAGRATGSTGVG